MWHSPQPGRWPFTIHKQVPYVTNPQAKWPFTIFIICASNLLDIPLPFILKALFQKQKKKYLKHWRIYLVYRYK